MHPLTVRSGNKGVSTKLQPRHIAVYTGTVAYMSKGSCQVLYENSQQNKRAFRSFLILNSSYRVFGYLTSETDRTIVYQLLTWGDSRSPMSRYVCHLVGQPSKNNDDTDWGSPPQFVVVTYVCCKSIVVSVCDAVHSAAVISLPWKSELLWRRVIALLTWYFLLKHAQFRNILIKSAFATRTFTV